MSSDNLKSNNNNQNQIFSGIVIAGVLIAGAILLRGSGGQVAKEYDKLSPLFNQCLEAGKYNEKVTKSTEGGHLAGVNSTPQAFILKDGQVVDIIVGAIPTTEIKQKIDKALEGTSPVIPNIKLEPISAEDFVRGNETATVTVVEYADFQCPFCGRFFRETEKNLLDEYVKAGKIKFIYRDFAFLGYESSQAAQAAHCAGEQGKFWEYHDYLYSHQNGENQGAFSTTNLKSFAGMLKLK